MNGTLPIPTGLIEERPNDQQALPNEEKNQINVAAQDRFWDVHSDNLPINQSRKIALIDTETVQPQHMNFEIKNQKYFYFKLPKSGGK
jgi:hypothetical protein